jgi:hypothetical protein
LFHLSDSTQKKPLGYSCPADFSRKKKATDMGLLLQFDLL